MVRNDPQAGADSLRHHIACAFMRGILVAALIALTTSGCLGGVSNHQATTTTPTYSEGSPFKNGGLTVTVEKVWQQKRIGDGDNPFSTHEPRGIWLIAAMHVKNDSDEQQSFEGMMQNLVVDGKKYSPDTFAGNDVVSDARSDASMNPGFEDNVVAAFDVPVGTFPAANEAYLDIQTEMMSPSVRVKIEGTPPTITS
jgi:Domain of unknown function (DUF4352)